MSDQEEPNDRLDAGDNQRPEARVQKLKAVLEAGKPQSPDIIAPKTSSPRKNPIRSILEKIFSSHNKEQE